MVNKPFKIKARVGARGKERKEVGAGNVLIKTLKLGVVA